MQDTPSGAILADEMGLGKSVQAIALIWTMLRQPVSKPILRNCLLVCPASLVRNWRNEFRKWLGIYRIPARVYPLLIDHCLYR